MAGVEQPVERCLEVIFVHESPLVNITLKLRKPCHQVNTGLLIARWGVCEVSKRAMELNRVVDVFEQPTANRGIEGDAC